MGRSIHTQTNFKGKRLSLSPKANSDCHIPCIETFLVPFNSLFGDSFNEQDVRHQSYCPPGDGSRRSGFGCRWRCCFRGRFVRQAWPFHDGDDPFGDSGRFLSDRGHPRSRRLENLQLAASRLKQYVRNTHALWVRVQRWWRLREMDMRARRTCAYVTCTWTSEKLMLILTIVIIVSSSSCHSPFNLFIFLWAEWKQKISSFSSTWTWS